jgi:hypothetical protein
VNSLRPTGLLGRKSVEKLPWLTRSAFGGCNFNWTGLPGQMPRLVVTLPGVTRPTKTIYMAKLAEGVHFTGTIGNICYYEIGDRTYSRIKSSLTRKRVLKNKEFEKTRKHAGDLALASKIASAIYKVLPSDIKGRWIFRAITGEAASLLYKGKTEQEVKDLLWKKYVQDTNCANEAAIKAGCVNVVPSTKQMNLQLKKIFMDRWERQGKPVYYFKRAWRWRQGNSFDREVIPGRLRYVRD